MSEQRTMRERLARVLFNRYGDAGDLFYQGEWDQTVDAILAELREPGWAVTEEMAMTMLKLLLDNRAGRADWSGEEVAEAAWRAAIDAIRDEGENAATKRPGQAQDDDAAR